MSAAYDRLVAALERHGSTVRVNGSSAMAQCPAPDHEDRNPSLSVSRADRFAGVLVKCQRSCHTDDVLDALGLGVRDLFDEPRERSAGYAVVAEYPYVDESGAVLFVQERRFPKDFRCKRPDGTGWSYKLGDTRRVLYRLPQVLAAVKAGQTVWLVEGERDADTLAALGHVATTSPLGAGKWRPEYGDTLTGGHVVVVADNDPDGLKHAAAVAADLVGKAASVRVVRAAVDVAKADVTDHVAAGHQLDELVPVEIQLVDGDLRDHDDGDLRDHDDDLDAETERALAFNRAVNDEAYRLRVRDSARELHRAETAVPAPPFDAGTLTEVLARPAEPPFRVEGLLPAGGSALVVAQRKTGKTTLELNLARCLLTGEPFLGTFDTRPVAGTVALLNYEVSGAQIARWAADVGIDPELLFLVNLRGRRNPLSTPEDRERLIELLVLHNTSTLLVDPFGRAYTGVSQNDPGEVGAWLADLDRFAADVGATETVLTAHAGWNGERTRGASALEDWADTIVTLVRDPDDESQRFLRAIGRDVEVDEDRLLFDPATRLLRLSGSGSRKAFAASRRSDELVEVIVGIVDETPGLNVAAIRKALRSRGVSFTTNDDSRAIAHAAERGLLRVEPGPRGSKLHYPGPSPAPPTPPTPEALRGAGDDPLHPLSIGGVGHRSGSEPDPLRAVRHAEQLDIPEPRSPASDTAPTVCTGCSGPVPYPRSVAADQCVDCYQAGPTPSEPVVESCTRCGQHILLLRPGRDTCERCRLELDDAAARP